MFDNTKDFPFNFRQIFAPLNNKKSILIIIVVGVLVFGNMLGNDFVWDDTTYILTNQEIHSITLEKIFGPSLFNDIIAGYYRPIPALYFTILYSLFKNTAFFYHLFQLTLHIICTILLFYFLKEFFKKSLSLLLSLIFLIHPIQVESVAYIAQTVSPLFFLFGMGAVLFNRKETLSFKRILLINILLLGSILTKETGFLFFIVVILFRVLFKKKKILISILFESSTILLYLSIRYLIGHVSFQKIPDVELAQLSLIQRLMNIPAICFYYLKTSFFPWELSIDQRWIVNTYDIYNFYIPLLADALFFLAVCSLGVYVYKKHEKAFFSFVFFAIWLVLGMFMHSQIFPLDMTVAERWFYFPLVGFLGIIGIYYKTSTQLRRISQKVKIASAILILILISGRTIIRNTNWNSALSLYTHDIAISDNYDIENGLGEEYLHTNNYSSAIHHFNKSLSFKITESSLNNLAKTYTNAGNVQKAKQYAERAYNNEANKASQIHKHLLITYVNYAEVLLFSNNFLRANRIIKKGLSEYPNDANLWLLLSLNNLKRGNRKDALYAITKAYQIEQTEYISYVYSSIRSNQQFQFSFTGKVFNF